MVSASETNTAKPPVYETTSSAMSCVLCSHPELIIPRASEPTGHPNDSVDALSKVKRQESFGGKVGQKGDDEKSDRQYTHRVSPAGLSRAAPGLRPGISGYGMAPGAGEYRG